MTGSLSCSLLPVTIPRFPECQHHLIEALADCSDRELLLQFQQQPQSGRYFVALFCRYAPLIYSLVQHSPPADLPDPPADSSTASSSNSAVPPAAVNLDHRFAQVWKHLYGDLQRLNLSPEVDSPSDPPQISGLSAVDEAVAVPQTLQSWIVDATARYLRSGDLPGGGDRYSLTYAPPPLWCYLERSLEALSPPHRLVVVLHRTFGWPLEEVTAYLRAKGADIDPAAVVTLLEEGFHLLNTHLPEDIQAIYLSQS